MQEKKGASPKKTSALASSGQAGEDARAADPKPKRGRPKTSPHDPKTQALLRVRQHRAKLKAAGAAKVETILPAAWHEYLQSVGTPWQELGLEAFALLLRARGKAELVGEAQSPSTTPDAPKGR